MIYDYTEERFELNEDTCKYELTEEEHRTVDDTFYFNCTCKDTLKFFRNLGGRETLTHRNGKHTLTSYSPSRGVKVVRTFINTL